MKRAILISLFALTSAMVFSQGTAATGAVKEYDLPTLDSQTGKAYIGQFGIGSYEITCNVSGINANNVGWKIGVSKQYGSTVNAVCIVFYNYIGGNFYAQCNGNGKFDLWWDSNATSSSQDWRPHLKVEYQTGSLDYTVAAPPRDTSTPELISPINIKGKNVGISNQSPANKLEIDNAFSFHSGGHKVIGLGYSVSNKSMIDGYVGEMRWDPTACIYSINTSAAAVKTGDVATFTNRLTINSLGNVGLGTNTPDSRLHIKGGLAIQNPNLPYDSNGDANARAGIMFGTNNNENRTMFWISPDATSGNRLHIGAGLDYSDKGLLTIVYNGNVGIGITNPSNKLEVNGTIRAKEIKVEAATWPDPWPDYVFADDYQLKDLSEVEQYINANNHLPDVPAAETMEQQGVNLGEMNRILLKKVEELTLYSIAQNKAIAEKEKEMQQVKAEIDGLKQQLEALLKQMNH